MIITSTSAGTAVVVGMVEVMVWGCGMGFWWREVREQNGTLIYTAERGPQIPVWLIIYLFIILYYIILYHL